MEGTRLRILQLLQQHDNETVDSLAKALTLAPATVRRHLDILQRDRLVAFEAVRKPTGRPEYSFYLTEIGHEALPKDYDLLLGRVVAELTTLTPDDIRGRGGEQVFELVLQRISGKIQHKYQQELAGKGLASRLAALVHLLRQEDFVPETEVAGQTLRIKLLNCPFRSVAMQNKGICSFDANLIATMLEQAPEREACIYDGDNSCMYTARITAGEAKQLLKAVGS